MRVLVRSVSATMEPAASESDSRVHSHERTARSSLELDPSSDTQRSGSETLRSPPAFAFGLRFSSTKKNPKR